jgi:hypothetical protein
MEIRIGLCRHGFGRRENSIALSRLRQTGTRPEWVDVYQGSISNRAVTPGSVGRNGIAVATKPTAGFEATRTCSHRQCRGRSPTPILLHLRGQLDSPQFRVQFAEDRSSTAAAQSRESPGRPLSTSEERNSCVRLVSVSLNTRLIRLSRCGR